MSIQIPDKSKLNTLDFSSGIRSEELNENFRLLEYWIEAERLRIGGWGLVEGFELTKNIITNNEAQGNKFWSATINVSPGLLINEDGKEVRVGEYTFNILPPRYTEITEIVESDENGLITLTHPMYSNTYHHVVYYFPHANETEIDENEFSIIDTESGDSAILNRDIEYIEENTVKLISSYWKNMKFEVTYLYSEDRIDPIFLYKDGTEYKDPMPLGMISTSPSEQVIQDYLQNGWYLIGLAYWHVGRSVDVEFLTGDRTLRKVFVDKNNVLYLNGKRYIEKTLIYFIEPENPVENDMWFNVEDEVLYIWRKNEKDVYEWLPVNDLSRSITSIHQFTEAENPEDLQTFSFEAYPELAFIPGHNQLTVIIDQVVIMRDQYEEIYNEHGEGLPSGTGFKLKRPLERPSLVEVRVLHNMNTNRKKIDLFAHQSLFGTSGTYKVTNVDNKIFNAKCHYQCFNSQIEVFLNGIRLVEGTDFNPILIDGTVATQNDVENECDKFQIEKTLHNNDIILFRVLRPMAAYSNMQAVVERYENLLDDYTEQIETINNNFTTKVTELETSNRQLAAQIQSNSAAISMLQGQGGATGVIIGKINLICDITGRIIFLTGVKTTDYINVAYIPSSGSNPIMLFENLNDYTVAATTGGINLTLNSKWTDDALAKLYVTGLNIGV